jgi:acyl-CoA synthetase (AMP-forming)/AMP-acid ligase II
MEWMTGFGMIDDVASSLPKEPPQMIQSKSAHQIIRDWVLYPSAPKKPAIIRVNSCGQTRTLTYADLRSGALAFMEALQGDGIRPGSAVGLYMERSEGMITAIYGSILAGQTFFTISPKFKVFDFPRVQSIRDAAVIVVDYAAVMKLGRDGICALADKTIYLWDDGSLTARHAAAVCSSNSNRFHTFLVKRSNGRRADPSSAHPEPADPCMLLQTSGSTGMIKGVQVSYEDMQRRVESEVTAYSISPDDRILNVLPFSFDVGCNQLFSTLNAGATLVISHSWAARDVCATILDFGVTGFSAVPTIWNSILACSEAETRTALSCLRYLAVSGGPISGTQIQRLQERAHGVDIYKTYGQTETFRSSMLHPHEVAMKPASVGRPVPGVSLYIERADGSLAKAGESGEILHAGSGAMIGYAGDPDLTETKRVPNPFGHGMIIRTGDIGYLDDDGFLYIQGRSDRMIKSRGSRIYPREVEEVALLYRSVVDAVCFPLVGIDNEISLGLAIKVESSFSKEELYRLLTRRLATFMVPLLTVMVEEFPRTVSGKVDLRAVEQFALA